ncbi:MAG: endopeptidase La [Bacteroidales bacterium]|jgi:ATP-dependent Lon protease|nr:endopeptidase La [Bacteroidales bacterium]
MAKSFYNFIIDPSLFIDIQEKGQDVLIPVNNETDQELPLPNILPVFPLSHTVLFPGVVLPINIGRAQPQKFIDDIYKNKQYIAVLSQKVGFLDRTLSVDDLYRVGTIAQIVKILEMPDGSRVLILHGKKRFTVDQFTGKNSLHCVKYHLFDDVLENENDPEYQALAATVKELSIRVIDFISTYSPETSFVIKNIDNPLLAVNFVAAHVPIKIVNQQKILEIPNLKHQATSLIDYLAQELQLLEIKHQIENKVKSDFDKQQREYMLQQQMKVIQEELGADPANQEFRYLEEAGAKKKWGREHEKVFERELKKLRRLNLASVEYSNQLNYLYTLLDLPWNEYTTDHFDLIRAKKILDEDHFGLEKVKERLLEYLAVLKLKNDLKSPILCLVGPPGVGKTSLGKSIAKALKRHYIRMSLGGLHDESEIRGHRKTYIGAMPGRVIQSIRKAKSANPVFVLDEIDKISIGPHGDPASALLEVLDPEQNNTFYDNYLELEFDLSKVMFIATANNLMSISPALRDRLEIIEVNGYVQEEKVCIAQKHLIRKQIEAHGLTDYHISFSKEAITYIIENYTRESGVRELDKSIASVIRNLAKKIVMETDFPKKLTTKHISDILGAPKYLYERYQGNEYAGVVTGLAWTSEGGDILFVESSLSHGTGTLTLTGNLGNVMKESAVIALEYLKSNYQLLDLPYDIFERWNVHVHVPEGAIPKDGPSAGLAMVVAIASAFTRRKIQDKIAMTGEITLRGKILPVGGIKEKILAAKRANITDIYIPVANLKDIAEVNELFIKDLNFTYVDDVSDVLQQVLLDEKVTNVPGIT